MKNFNDKNVLITGAGSGIGQQTALAFAKLGANLWLADLNEEGNQETATQIQALGGRASTFRCDVADPESVEQLALAVHREIEAVDVLINNAGIGASGRFLDTKLASWKKVMDVNLMGVVHGCHYFLPNMVEVAKADKSRAGHVVNLSSLAGYVAAAEMSIYATSKFAVFGFSESLRSDMKAHGIGVSAICPGIINTPIVANTLVEGALAEDKEAHEKVIEFYKKRNYSPAQVADRIVAAVKKNRGVQPVSPESWVMYYAKRFLPGIVAMLGGSEAPATSK
jgi:NAD(P)-dependent dehydrogenase (short-subunit alcohol dehydrogenase family)